LSIFFKNLTLSERYFIIDSVVEVSVELKGKRKTLKLINDRRNTMNRSAESPFCEAEVAFAEDTIKDELVECVDCGTELVATSLEPVQGEGGVNIGRREYFRNVRRLCDERDILLIIDEVQTGFCRTGRLNGFASFAAADHNIPPTGHSSKIRFVLN
jgi:4-aminobutyrate aminotransferase-like enzyme